jgi:outer membrane protein assembly factor BamA
MKLTLSIFASLILAATAAQAEQNASDKPAKAPAAVEQKSDQPAYELDLEKIDDVNPFVIKAIIVDGNKLIPRSQVKAVIKTQPGDFYHKKDIERDIKAINNLGYFSDKDLHIDSHTTAAGMVITIHLKENPLFKSIAFSGNKIVPTAQMQGLFKEQLLKPQSTTQITASLKSIESLYKTEGYLLAHTSIQKDDPNGNLTVTVDEGIVSDIKISCQTDEQKNILQSALTLKVGDPYNEKQVATDLKTAFKSGKFDNLQRDVLADKDKAASYIVSIKSVPKSKESQSKAPKTSSSLLTQTKSKSSLPVLNKLIHSPMYKNIK